MQEKNYDFKQKWFEYLGYKPHDGQIPLHFPNVGEDLEKHGLVLWRLLM